MRTLEWYIRESKLDPGFLGEFLRVKFALAAWLPQTL
jgi:hypothetical protein